MRRRSLVLLVALAALWGSSYLMIRVALDDLGPAAVACGRTALGALFLLPIAHRAGALRGLGRHRRAFVVTGVVQLALPLVLIAIGEQWITSSLAGLLQSSVPIFVALLALWLDPGERAGLQRWLGIALGFAGVALVVGFEVGGGLYALLGAGALLLSSVGYALGPLYAKKRLAGLPPLGIASVLAAVATVALLPAAAVAPPDHGPALETWAAMLLLGVFGTGLGFLMYYALMQDVGPGRASFVAYLIPAFAILYGGLLADEPIGRWALVGLALILTGSYVATNARSQVSLAAPSSTGLDTSRTLPPAPPPSREA
jgi:drug/metabolite transporter (DMT)-like permease